MRSCLQAVHRFGVKTGDYPVHALGMRRGLIAQSVSFGQLVGLPIIGESLVVLPGVVEVLAQRIVQTDGVPERQPLCNQGLSTFEPRMVSIRHFAMAGDAGPGVWKIRID